MDTTIERVENITFITAEYEAIDAGSVADFKRDVEAVIEDNARVILDLAKVEFVDSAGLGGIVWLLKQLVAKGGDLKVCGISSSVRALFELIRMHRLVAIHNDRDEAERAFRG
jgi:anti-sigma B factor antagonist